MDASKKAENARNLGRRRDLSSPDRVRSPLWNELHELRDQAVEIIRQFNRFACSVAAVEHLLANLPDDDPARRPLTEALAALRPRLEAWAAEKEAAKELVTCREREIQELVLAEALAEYPEANRAQAKELLRAKDAEMLELIKSAPVGDLAHIAGKVFHLEYRLRQAESSGDDLQSAAAREALAKARPAMEAEEALWEECRRKQRNLEAKYRRRLRKLLA